MGGIDTMLVDILNEHVKKVKTTLIIINDLVDSEVLLPLDKKIKVIKIKRKLGSRNPFIYLKLNYFIYKIKPTIIHCHNSKLVKLILIKEIPIVLTVHAMKYCSKNYHLYDKIFAISLAVKRDIQKNGNFPVKLVHNGVKTSDIISPKRGFFSLPMRIVVVGRLDCDTKGQDILIKAIKQIDLKQ